jgi:hypothetical protein
MPISQIVTNSIANEAVVTADLANSAVTTVKIADGAITTAKIAAGAVVADDIANGAVTRAKMGYAGAVLQVQQTTLTSTLSLTANQSYTAVTGLSTTITPTSTSSRVLVTVTIMWGCTGTTFAGSLFRNGSVISGAIGNAGSGQQQVSFPMPNQQYDGNQAMYTSFTYLDSPASISAQTYALYVISDNNATLGINRATNDSANPTGKRGISTITAMEIAG